MSAYNLKVVQYNGFLQFRIYDRPIMVEDADTNINEKIKDELYQLNFVENEEKKEDDRSATKTDNEKNEHSERVSINRTIQNIYDYTLNNNWDWFVTLTFAEKKVNRNDYSEVMKKTCNWCKNMRNRYAPNMKYLFLAEKHEKGGYHVHGLFADCGNIQFEDSGRVAIGKKAYLRTEKNEHYPTIYNIENWKNGWSTATRVQNSVRCASYITKYITKNLCKEIPGKRRFYPSNNLEKSIQTVYNLPENEIWNMLNSYEIDYMKVQHIPDAGQTIKYITVKL